MYRLITVLRINILRINCSPNWLYLKDKSCLYLYIPSPPVYVYTSLQHIPPVVISDIHRLVGDICALVGYSELEPKITQNNPEERRYILLLTLYIDKVLSKLF